jgi:hypothetical protein
MIELPEAVHIADQLNDTGLPPQKESSGNIKLELKI